MKNTNKIVKIVQRYLILSLLAVFSVAANAQIKNHIGLWGEVGEWSLLPQASQYPNSLGVAGGLGLMYDLQYKKHLIFDIGVGVNYGMTSFNRSSSAADTLFNQVDLQGESFNYVYQINDRHDQYRNMMIQVPVMIGGQWGRFYGLVGVKAGLSLLTKSFSKANITTFGDYAFFDDFKSMPEYQFFDNVPFEKSFDAKFRFNLDVSAEIGLRLGFLTDLRGFDVPKSKVQYRLGLFADYGLLDIHTADNRTALTLPSGYNTGETAPVYGTRTMLDNITMNDVMTTSGFASAVHNLLVGVKFTVLFELPEPRQCVICRDQSLFRSAPVKRGTKINKD